MTDFETLTESEKNRLASLLWDFLAPRDNPERSDAVFVFGGINLKVPGKAADLYEQGYAPTVLVSGGTGSRTHLHFDGPEADVFVKVLVGRGVPTDAMIIEPNASNSGQNVEFGMAMLLEEVPSASSALLVSAPFIMRRCLATFEKQYPQVRVTPCPPEGGLDDFVDRPYDEFIERLVAELDRIDTYTEQGYIAPVEVPNDVRAAAEALRAVPKTI